MSDFSEYIRKMNNELTTGTVLVLFRKDLRGGCDEISFDKLDIYHFKLGSMDPMNRNDVVMFIDDEQSTMPTKILKNRFGGGNLHT